MNCALTIWDCEAIPMMKRKNKNKPKAKKIQVNEFQKKDPKKLCNDLQIFHLCTKYKWDRERERGGGGGERRRKKKQLCTKKVIKFPAHSNVIYRLHLTRSIDWALNGLMSFCFIFSPFLIIENLLFTLLPKCNCCRISKITMAWYGQEKESYISMMSMWKKMKMMTRREATATHKCYYVIKSKTRKCDMPFLTCALIVDSDTTYITSINDRM